jgi:aminomethyltransferase
VEAGIIAMRSDFPAKTTPYHVGLERLVDLNKPVDFIGKTALRRISRQGVAWKLVGLEFDAVPEFSEPASFAGQTVLHHNRPVGRTTVVVFSPRLNRMIGYARLATNAAELGTPIQVDGRNGRQTARVVSRPFLDAAKSDPRR